MMGDVTEPKKMKISEEARAEETGETSIDDQTTSGEKEQISFSVKTWKEDLKLIVEGRAIYVNKAVLAIVSPVFETMFTANFKEKNTDEIEMPDKSYDSFVNFLECVYPGNTKQITAETVMGIIPLVDEYQMLHLLPRCDAVLADSIRSTSSIDYIYTNIKLSSLYNLKETQKRCVEIASEQTLADIMANKEKYEIPSEVNEKILRHGFRRQELDIEELNAIVKQLEAVSKSRGDFVRKILGMHYFSVDIPKKELNKYDFSSLSDKLLQDLKGEHTVKWPSLTQKNNFSSQTDPQLLYLKVIKKIGGGELQTCNDLTTAALAGLNDSDLFRYFPVAMKEKIHCLRDKKFGLAEH